ncbi:MAG: hypothetical protein Q4E05_06140 [Pseudoclavibacter sp.]|nr:hypothetical protein [Pseudoclavibacter sp.]
MHRFAMPPRGIPRNGEAIGFVELTVQGNPLAPTAFPPRIRVDGQLMHLPQGRHAIPVRAGPVRVEADVRWVLRYGRASLDFPLAPGQSVPVFYAPPLYQFCRGAMGHVPQKRPGAVPFFITVGVGLAALAGLIALIVLLG